MRPGNGTETVEAPRPPWLWPRAAYLHVPFCAQRCCYCDFAIAVGQDDLSDPYLGALVQELARLGTPQPVDTLFLGGGTPTHLSARQLERLLRDVLHWLPPRQGHEFSVEANPGSLDEDKADVLGGHGVTRVSLGVQSFQPPLLRFLGRDHTREDVAPAIERLRRQGIQVSVDLIFGMPGQTFPQWEDDLRYALNLLPDHLSTYGLTYEKGTPLWKQRRQGAVRPLDEEAELALYAHAIDTLEASGFEQYEISNFARPGRRCRHNEVYWANHAYFGFGMGAARYVDGRRELNTRDLHTYLRKIECGESATFQSEKLASKERALETLALQLRRAEGIDRPAFQEQTGFALDDLMGPVLRRHVDLGLLAEDGVGVRLTRRGKYVADAVIEALLAGAS